MSTADPGTFWKVCEASRSRTATCAWISCRSMVIGASPILLAVMEKRLAIVRAGYRKSQMWRWRWRERVTER